MEDALAFHKELSNENWKECKICHKNNRDTNSLTTFLFVQVLECSINNISKSFTELMIIIPIGLSILFNDDNHLAPLHVFSS